MKHTTLHSPLYTLLSTLYTLLPATAALPEKWDVELAAQPPQVFTLQRPRGETYELEAVLKNHGKPFAPAITNAFIYWQTNGMENLYWSAPASVSNNVLRASWLPSMDPGAATVRGYIGDPGHIYAAAFQFRFIASPGETPNELPLPQKVIDFAKVTVLNPPWSGGGGSVDTNAVRDIVREEIAPATNRLTQTLTDSTNRLYKTLIDAMPTGDARLLPKYLWIYNADDSYHEEAAAYYRSRGNGKVDGGCSAVRSGGFLYRNFDFPLDERAEFVVKMSAANGRFASVGVAQVGTNLTEQMVTSGKPEYSARYKWLPGATVDGINENGVVAEINVVDGPLSGWHTTGDLHPLAAVRWVLDHATNAQHAATYLAANIRFPQGWAQNFHYMIADETSTYIVENGSAHDVTDGVKVMTNFRLFPSRDTTGAGQERYDLLLSSACCITNAWYTRAYSPETSWLSDFNGSETLMATSKVLWASKPREQHRGEILHSTTTTSDYDYTWWQTVHTSIYDITNRVLRICVQETPDWYTFQVPSTGGGGGVAVETDPTVPSWAKQPAPPVTPSEVNVGFALNADWANGSSNAEIADWAENSVNAQYADWSDNSNMALDVDPDAPGLSGKADKLPYLRVFDEVLQCWWIGRMVNGVMQWEVE